MIQLIKNLISEIKLLTSFQPMLKPIVLTRPMTERFDVVERTPSNTGIKIR
jgi:hypothetical protein